MKRGGKERRPRGSSWLTEVWASTRGAAAFGLVPAVLQNGSSSEARPPTGSGSWGSCFDSSGSWWASLLRPRGPAVPACLWAGAPLSASRALGFRNSTGGGLQSLGNMSPSACILGFFGDLGAGAEEGLQRRRVGCRSPWCRGWSRQLLFRSGKRMGLAAAA